MPHTPGPWQARAAASISGFDITAPQTMICHVLERLVRIPRISRAESEGNAYLIAAAPELLAALKTVEIIECWECRGSGDHCTGDGKPCPDCDGTGLLVADGDPKAIKQAIAKAEGKP